jgi:hypothetical protein
MSRRLIILYVLGALLLIGGGVPTVMAAGSWLGLSKLQISGVAAEGTASSCGYYSGWLTRFSPRAEILLSYQNEQGNPREGRLPTGYLACGEALQHYGTDPVALHYIPGEPDSGFADTAFEDAKSAEMQLAGIFGALALAGIGLLVWGFTGSRQRD